MFRLIVVCVSLTVIVSVLLIKHFTQDKVSEEVKVVKKTEKKITEVKKKVVFTSVSEKKAHFFKLMVEPLNEVHDSLQKQFHETRNLILVDEDSMSLDALKKKYKVKTNQELLIAIKPHPQSIALAQGALESAWGTSRFFKEANNIFGVWSFSKKDKRIAASSKRGKKTIWLKKYDSIKEAIEDYYLTTSRSKAFKAFKKLNYEKENQNPYLLVTKLDKYSEKGALYGKELSSVISFNNLTRFDEVHYTREKESRVIKD